MSSTPSTLVEAAARLRAGEATPAALVEACLERIAREDDLLRAWVFVDGENARREALRLGDELARGQPRSPLHGIPVGVKDIFKVKGLPTEAGSPLMRGNVAAADGPVVARLRRAGAVILGKTVTTEFACFDPSPTRNPWNRNHTPGGSSSGSAAAVAAGMCLAALGSQTGGSITRPASYCGVCGLKPTYGRLSVQGVVPVSFHLDHVGFLTRTVADLAVVWSVLGEEEVSPGEEERTRPPRLTLFGEFFEERADDAVRAATREAVAQLQAAGATVPTRRLPANFLEVHANHRRIMAVEAAEFHRRLYHKHGEQYGPNLSALVEEGLSVAAVDYAESLKFQSTFRREMMELLEGYDALLTPATTTPAPAGLETTGDPAFNSPWSLAGLPTVSLPCGLSPEGLPCSLQLIGRWRGESNLLRTALWCEQALGFDAAPRDNVDHSLRERLPASKTSPS